MTDAIPVESISKQIRKRNQRVTRTDLDEQRDGDDDRVDDLLPCLELDAAFVFDTACIGEVAIIEEVLARVHEIIEEAGADDRDDDVDPGEHGVKLHQSACAEDRAEESAELRSAKNLEGRNASDAPSESNACEESENAAYNS